MTMMTMIMCDNYGHEQQVLQSLSKR